MSDTDRIFWPERPAWRAHAACRGKTDLFFDDNGSSRNQAKKLCQDCPVRQSCFDFAVNNVGSEQVSIGVWAGMTGSALRRRMRRRYAS